MAALFQLIVYLSLVSACVLCMDQDNEERMKRGGDFFVMSDNQPRPITTREFDEHLETVALKKRLFGGSFRIDIPILDRIATDVLITTGAALGTQTGIPGGNIVGAAMGAELAKELTKE